MKMFEALAMLMAAREGKLPQKRTAVKRYGEKSKRALRQIGIKEEEIYNEYPDKELNNGIFLICNHPIVFAEQARASAAWLINRN
jgi:uncharacterized protein YjiS (DUF1127 family)